jgi:hypothetical protein
MGRRFSDADARRTGDLAEAHVTKACRAQLSGAGRDDLAALVRRVSLTSDQLGYDVTAPRLDGSTRRLEVKGTRMSGQQLLVVHPPMSGIVRIEGPEDAFSPVFTGKVVSLRLASRAIRGISSGGHESRTTHRGFPSSGRSVKTSTMR